MNMQKLCEILRENYKHLTVIINKLSSRMFQKISCMNNDISLKLKLLIAIDLFNLNCDNGNANFIGILVSSHE